jgi:hypothetical protein
MLTLPTVTVSVALPTMLFAEVAVIVACPGPTPVAMPLASTVAMLVFELCQVYVLDVGWLLASTADGVNCFV